VRVLMVWPQFPPQIGGMQVHGLAFAQYLMDRGVSLLIASYLPSDGNELEDFQSFDDRWGLPCARTLRPHDFRQVIQEIRQLATRFRPSVIYTSHATLAPVLRPFAPVVARTAGNDLLRPWIGPAWTGDRQRMSELTTQDRLRRQNENRNWAQFAAPFCDLLLANTEWTADMVRSLPFKRIDVALGGVDTRQFRPRDKSSAREACGLPRDSFVITVACRHVIKKGLQIAIPALSGLVGITLQVLGQGPETARLKALAHDMRCPAIFLGPRAHDEMPLHLSSSDIVLAPSVEPFEDWRQATDYESMGRVICEASSSGIPVIASRIGGIPEVLADRETGLLVTSGDVREVSQAVRYLLSNSSARTTMGRRGRTLAVNRLGFDDVNAKTMTSLLETANETAM
jgi:phosphatidyl-myo-inositol dimannoside synthase